jgi:hypothetical protein
MAGFQLPITQYTPAQLAEMARLAFKPPALMGGGGGGGGLGQLPQSPGFNLGQGIAGTAPGLGALAGQLGKGPDLNARTRASDAEIAQWSNMASPSDYAALNRVTAGPSIDSEIAQWSNYGGARADGGPVTPGKYYTVGEQGPETFVPDVPGRIVPTDQYNGAPAPGYVPGWETQGAPAPGYVPGWETQGAPAPGYVPGWETQGAPAPGYVPGWETQGAPAPGYVPGWETQGAPVPGYVPGWETRGKRDFFGGTQMAQAQVGGSPAYPTSDFSGDKQLDAMYRSMLGKANDEGWDTKWINDWYRKQLNQTVTPIMRRGG